MARRRYQQGSVSLLSSGRWILRWREDVIEEGGVVRRVCRKTPLGTKDELPTKKLAMREAETVLAKINDRSYRPGRIAAFSRFAEDWERDALVMLKPSTQRVHKSYLDVHLLPSLGEMRLDELDQQRVQGFVARLSQKVKPKTVANVVGVLGAMLKVAKAWGYSVGPVDTTALALPRPGLRVERPCFTAEEVQAILAASAPPYRAAWATMAFTGCRAGEAFALTWEDVDLGGMVLHVRRSNYRGLVQTVKTPASRRTLPIPGPLAEILEEHSRAWTPNDGGHLFAGDDGLPMNPEAVLRWRFKPLLKRLGIRRAGHHAFRHAQASLLVNTGASVKVTQAQLGHSDPRITLGLYSHLVGAEHRVAVEKVAEILRPVASDARPKLVRIK